MAGTLTSKEIAVECARLLEPVTRHVRAKMGDEAADLTGGCLFKALISYDHARSNGLDSYARAKTLFLVVEALRELDGRKGTRRYAMTSATVGVGDWDAPATCPDSPPDHDDQLRKTFDVVENATPLGRLILMGRVLCNLTDTDLCGLINVSQTQIRNETLALQRSVSLG